MSYVKYMNGSDADLLAKADEVAKWVERETHAAVARGEAVLAQKAVRVLEQIRNGQSVVAFVDGQIVERGGAGGLGG